MYMSALEDLVIRHCRQKMVEGRVNKLVKEKALLEQAFIKDTSKTVNDLVKETTAQLGEKVSIRRFSRQVTPGSERPSPLLFSQSNSFWSYNLWTRDDM